MFSPAADRPVGHVCRQPIIGIDASRANRPLRTGVEWYAFHVIQELKKVVPPSFRVVLYSAEPLRDGLENLPPNWESRVLKWPPRRLWTQLRLAWETLARPTDLLFIPVHALPLLGRTRVVNTLHDVAFMPFPQTYGPLERLYQIFITWFAVRRAVKILTNTEFTKKELIERFGAAAGKIAVTPLGFDQALCRPAEPDALQSVLERYNIRQPYFIFLGRLEAKKNLSGLLRAFRSYAEKGGAGDLVLVGKRGYGYEKEHRSLDDMPADIRKRVMETGYACEDDMRFLLSGATALVFPSWYEGFGIPVIEAFACGTPVICSGTTALPEVAGDAALYADPNQPEEFAEQMRHVTTEAGLREGLIAKGRERVRQYSWEKTAAMTWDELKRLLRGSCG
ncbi:MAG: glycosyltransferase family 1 protein [Patescibacteria group bacterium]|nr:glycosyltransferase family 1 protein [Patescibacteria group bacterium]